MEEAKSLSLGRVIRFGVFQVNLAARELRKHGVPVRLPGQPFCILSMLLDRPGEIVTREEMRQKLWASDTFVDFEHSLNTAIKKLRSALGDSPENSRYIETIPRFGYRFIAPVEAVQVGANSVSTKDVTFLPQQQVPGQATTPARRAAVVWAAVAVCGVFLSVVIGLALFPARTPHVTSTTRLTRSGRIDDWANLVTDGPRIYFLERDGGHWNVMQTSTQGGSSQPVGAAFPGSNARILDVSRDLSQFLVGAFVMRNTEMPLWAFPVQGGAPHRLGNIQTKRAVWSPDGKGVLYLHDKDLMMADADGENARKLLTAPGRVYDFSFSPNGRIIRFTLENPHTTSGELWEVSVDGTALHRLFSSWTKSPGECCGRWTPDGRYYIFLGWQGGRQGVWAVRESRGLHFWKQPAPVNLISGPTLFTQMILGHDGRQLFALGQNVEGDMMRYDQKSRALVPIPGLPRNSAVFYCPTNEWILYQSDTDFSLWRSKADGSQPLQLTRPLPRIAESRMVSGRNANRVYGSRRGTRSRHSDLSLAS